MTPPRVSIGLAVRNGATYLVQAIESILAQTFPDFELIISDNASTDSTDEICRHYAEQDTRIRYYRNVRNIGGAKNENLTFTLAHGEYFRWAAHDDVFAPSLLEKCVAVLDQHPDVVLCYTETADIDQNGTITRYTKPGKGQQNEPHRRLHDVMYRDHGCEMLYGLMRSETMRKTRLQLDYIESDRTLLCELALRGRLYEVPEPLFYKRYHPANQYIDLHERMAWFKPGTEGTISFPYWSQFLDMYHTIHRVPLSLDEKLLCYLVTGRWSLRQSLRLLREPVKVGYIALHSKQWRVRRHESAHNWE